MTRRPPFMALLTRHNGERFSATCSEEERTIDVAELYQQELSMADETTKPKLLDQLRNEIPVRHGRKATPLSLSEAERAMSEAWHWLCLIGQTSSLAASW